jgi:hypothetical protein
MINPSPIASGTRFHHYQSDIRAMGRRAASATPSESGINWALFRSPSLLRFCRWLRASGQWQPVHVNSPCDCSGQYFARGVSIRKVGNRILLTQLWGYDV